MLRVSRRGLDYSKSGSDWESSPALPQAASTRCAIQTWKEQRREVFTKQSEQKKRGSSNGPMRLAKGKGDPLFVMEMNMMERA